VVPLLAIIGRQNLYTDKFLTKIQQNIKNLIEKEQGFLTVSSELSH
jgi:hypothetical protein